MAEIGFINPRNTADDTLPTSFVPMTLISAEYGVSCTHEIRPWGEIKSGFTHFADGDVALAKITPCFQNGKSTVFRNLTGGIGAGTTELHVVRPVLINPDYALIFLKSPHFVEAGIPLMTGTAGQKRVATEYFANAPFPLPPLAEQRRIVAKVDELMVLCDRLEAAQAEREKRRNRLAAASLNRLNRPDDEARAFRAHARFHLCHLARFTVRPIKYPPSAKQFSVWGLADAWSARTQTTNRRRNCSSGYRWRRCGSARPGRLRKRSRYGQSRMMTCRSAFQQPGPGLESAIVRFARNMERPLSPITSNRASPFSRWGTSKAGKSFLEGKRRSLETLKIFRGCS